MQKTKTYKNGLRLSYNPASEEDITASCVNDYIRFKTAMTPVVTAEQSQWQLMAFSVLDRSRENVKLKEIPTHNYPDIEAAVNRLHEVIEGCTAEAASNARDREKERLKGEIARKESQLQALEFFS